MPVSGWYHHKAEQCARLAAAATDPVIRIRYEEEGVLWRGIARDIAKQERSESGPP